MQWEHALAAGRHFSELNYIAPQWKINVAIDSHGQRIALPAGPGAGLRFSATDALRLMNGLPRQRRLET